MGESPEINDVVADEETGMTVPVFNKEGLRAMGMALERKFREYEKDRKGAELQWLANARQRLGIYEPEVLKRIGKTRSKAYPKVTRAKCVGMLSKLMNLLFTVGDKNWTVGPTAVPNLHADDLKVVLDKLVEGHDPNAPFDDDEIEQAIREFAAVRGRNLEMLIEDQLSELGGDRTLSYTRLCRSVLKSGIDYGLGVLTGPFEDVREVRTWTADLDGRPVPIKREVSRPLFEFVPVWDYYPDMSARYFNQMAGQFLRKVMSKHQLIQLKSRDDFIADAIDQILTDMPKGNYEKKSFETELTSHGVQSVSSSTSPEAFGGKYEVLVWMGFFSGRSLREAGIDVLEERLNEDVRAHLWFIKNTVIKAVIDPWSSLLGDDDTVEMFHQFIFEEDETSLVGSGLPQVVSDSQLGICAAARMILDNSSIQRNFEINTALLRIDQDYATTSNDKVWYRDDDGPAVNVPAVRVIDIPSKLPELQQIVQLFQGFADQETFVSAALGSGKNDAPSEPFRTAAGSSMLRGEIALPYKDVVRNFDVFTESVIRSIVVFNKIFNAPENINIRGDFQAVARGATSLIAKEVLGIQLDNLAATLTDEEKKYVDFRSLLAQRVRVRDLEESDVVVDLATAKRIDEAESVRADEARQQQNQQLSAELRKTLAETLKNMSLANKNAAAAEAQTGKLILDSLEEGLNATTEAGEGADNSVAQQQINPAGTGADQPVGAQIGQGQGLAAALPARSVSSGAG
jgi:hypothetical protein